MAQLASSQFTKYLKYEKYSNDDYSFFENGSNPIGVGTYTEPPIEGTSMRNTRQMIDELLKEKVSSDVELLVDDSSAKKRSFKELET